MYELPTRVFLVERKASNGGLELEQAPARERVVGPKVLRELHCESSATNPSTAQSNIGDSSNPEAKVFPAYAATLDPANIT